jgi:hypothetical protein
MRDHEAATGNGRRGAGQRLRDVLIRQAMEPVSTHPLTMKAIGNGVPLGDFSVPPMERGIEASHLRQLGTAGANGAYRREIVRLVERGQRRQTLESIQHGIIDHRRPAIIVAAMDHPMADRPRQRAAQLLREPDHELVERGMRVRDFARRPRFVGKRLPILGLREETRMGADAIDLPLHAPRQLGIRVDREKLEFDAGAAGVEHQDRVGHWIRPARAGSCADSRHRAPQPRRRPCAS